MKKLLIAALAAGSLLGATADEAKEELVEENGAPLFWGFGNYGVYSGYQLYGSLVNNEPTAQGYVEGNFNIPYDIGYVGIGLWSNTDLTKRRRCNSLGQAFNEWDPNIHFGRTFWFDDEQQWGLEWRSTIVWFYYPPKNYKGGRVTNHTTWDFDHSFALVNPYVVPYVTVVREYSKGANLVVLGLKRGFQIGDQLSLCPSLELVWRERQYNWCFPTAFNGTVNGYDCNKNSGFATLKAQLDANYQITENFGLFAKVAFCSIVDSDLRDNVDHLYRQGHDWYSYGAHNKDYVWGGIGVTFSF